MVVKLFSTKKSYFVSASFFIVWNVCGSFGSNPVSATKKRPFGRLVAESTGLRDAVALSHKTSKFAIAALRLCSLRCFVPLQTFFAGAAAKKTLSGPFGSSPVSAAKKNALTGVWWRRVQDSNLCTVIHGDGLAIRCITTLPTLH